MQTRTVLGMVLKTLPDETYRFSTETVETNVGKFYGIILDSPANNLSLGNLGSGGLVSYGISVTLENPVQVNGERYFNDKVNILRDRLVFAEFYECTGTQKELEDFSNWERIAIGKVRAPISTYISGVDVEYISIEIQTLLTEFSLGNVNLSNARQSTAEFTELIPKVYGDGIVPCFYAGEDDDYYYYKICEGPIESIDEIYINESYPYYIHPRDYWLDFGVFRLCKNSHYPLFYKQNFDDNVISAKISGYVNRLIKNEDSNNFRDYWGIEFPITIDPNWNVSNANLSISGGNLVITPIASGDITIDFGRSLAADGGFLNFGQFPVSHFRIKTIQSVVSALPADLRIDFADNADADNFDDTYRALSVLTYDGTWQSIDYDLFKGDSGINRKNVLWQTNRIKSLRLRFSGVEAADEFQIEFVKLSTLGTTNTLDVQSKDLIVSHTEEIFNLFSNSLGYSKYKFETDISNMIEENTVFSEDAKIGRYIWGTGVEVYQFSAAFYVFDLPLGTRFLLNINHSFLLNKYQLHSRRCIAQVYRQPQVGPPIPEYYDPITETWAIGTKSMIGNVIDPVHWNRSLFTFKTPDTLTGSYVYGVILFVDGLSNAVQVVDSNDNLGKPQVKMRNGVDPYYNGLIDPYVSTLIEGNKFEDINDDVYEITESLEPSSEADTYREFYVDTYPKETGTQDKSTTVFADGQGIAAQPNCYFNGISLKPYPENISTDIQRIIKYIPTFRYINERTNLEGELSQLYRETGLVFHPDNNNQIAAAIANKNAFAEEDILEITADDIRDFQILGDGDDLSKTSFFGYAKFNPLTEEFEQRISNTHRSENNVLIEDQFDFQWLRGTSAPKDRQVSRLSFQDGVNIQDDPNVDILRPWTLKDCRITLIGKKVSELKLGRPVRFTFETIDDNFFIKSYDTGVLKGNKIASVILSSIYTGHGYNNEYTGNTRVHRFRDDGVIKFSVDDPAIKNHFSSN